MNIVCCFDRGFYKGFVVMMRSLVDHLEETSLRVFVIHRSLDARACEELDGLVSRFTEGIELRFIKAEGSSLPRQVPRPGHFRLENYFRLLIPALLPQEIDRVLYLDCDLLITDNATEIYNAPLEGKAIAIAGNWNSGVMVMNLAEWRERNFGERMLQFAAENPEQCPLADNSAIMKILSSEDAHFLNERWNASHEVNEGHKGVIHFVGAVKPWHFNYPANGHRSLFYQTLDRTPFRGWRPTAPRWHEALAASIKGRLKALVFIRKLLGK